MGYTDANGAGASYSYDGSGLRAGKVAGGAATAFAWDRSGGLPLLLAEGGAAGTTKYLYGPGGLPIEQADGAGTALYYLQDQQGSTRQLADAAGRVVASYSYDAFGARTRTGGTAVAGLGYDGEYADAESGLIYLRARYYDPATAGFLTRDPLEALTGSAYGYAGNDPLNAGDPSGLCQGSPVDYFNCFRDAARNSEAGRDIYQTALGFADAAGGTVRAVSGRGTKPMKLRAGPRRSRP